MRDPLLSVHMVTYNHEPYIAQAIEGVLLQQTSFPLELVIGEDCSSDRTRDIVFAYEKRYPDVIRVVTSDHNVGASENGARVCKACRGKYVAICDGDDYWVDPCKLQKQVEFLETHPKYSLCCHDAKVVSEGVPRVQRWVDFTEDTFSFGDVVKNHFIPSLSVVCRREPIAVLPEWAKKCVSADRVMELMVLDHGLGYYIHETMGVKRDNPGGVTQAPDRKEILDASFLRMYKQLNVHTGKRHQAVLRWKIAGLSLKIAKKHFEAGRPIRFAQKLAESLVYDKSVLSQARTARKIGKALRWPHSEPSSNEA